MAAVLPEQVAYMSRFCAAELRDQAIQLDKERVQFVGEQAAVGFCLDNKFADVGRVASYSELARNWKKEGKRIAQPYFSLIANKKIRPEQLKAIQTARLALPDTEAGKELLKRIVVERVDTSSELRMRELLKWLNL
jgi:phosphonate transport system substrate-binding protein